MGSGGRPFNGIVRQHPEVKPPAPFIRFRGEGPGAITADGSAVELYLRSAYRGEVELIAPWLTGGHVLELGCGVGRMTNHLIGRGLRVTAVDNSEAMLAHVPSQANRILSDIETLNLGSHFDAVILASCLINVPMPRQRAALVTAAYRHLRQGGRFIFERHDPAWLATAREGPLRVSGEIEQSIDRLVRSADGVEISLRSKAGTDVWIQHFVTTPLNDAEVAECLMKAGFSRPLWINKRWGYADKDAV
jgi:SAM-dependent methyltransferase